MCFLSSKNRNYENIMKDEMWREIPTNLCKEFIDYILLDCENSSTVLNVSTTYPPPTTRVPAATTTNAPDANSRVPTVNLNVNLLADAIANRMRVNNNANPNQNANNQIPPHAN